MANVSKVRGGLAVLTRLAELEAEVQEARQLNLRLAELLDIVGELLIPLAATADPRAQELIARFQESVSSTTQTEQDAQG